MKTLLIKTLTVLLKNNGSNGLTSVSLSTFSDVIAALYICALFGYPLTPLWGTMRNLDNTALLLATEIILDIFARR